MGLNIEKIGSNLFRLDVRVRRPGGPGEDRVRETVEGDYQAAAARYLELRKEIKERQTLRCRFETLGDLLRFYVDERPPAPKDLATLEMLDREFGALGLPAFPDRFAAWRKAAQRTPSAKTGRPLSNGTLNRYTALVRAAFQLAVDQDPPLLERSPITKAKFPHLKEIPRDTVLDPATELNLFNIMLKHRPWILPAVAYARAVPVRKSELGRLPKANLDLINRRIRFRNGTTKNDKGGWKPIPADQMPYFQSIPADCPWVFYRVVNGRYRPLGDFKKAWNWCLDAAGIEDFHFHDTRHMSATDLLNNGTPSRAVQDIAGWNTDMMRIYFHRDSAASADLARFSPGVRTLAAYTPEEREGKEAVG